MHRLYKSPRVRPPGNSEWDVSQLPSDRMIYLDKDISFDEMATRVATEATVIDVRLKPYKTPGPGDPKDAWQARQVIFLVSVGDQLCDLLFNAPDGLRGRYWQSPDHGWLATRHLISGLSNALISFSDKVPPSAPRNVEPMQSKDIISSLDGVSTKVWPREPLLEIKRQLVVSRWQKNEEHAEINKGFWRLTPTSGELEIKGALLGLDGTEYLPEGKKDRSCQIHRYGFS